MKLVVVESPTKAKTISKFLPKEYYVIASQGHIRDLPRNAAEVPAKFKKEKWASLGVDVKNDYNPLYVISSEKKKIIKSLKEHLEKSDELILATDEDREGESISWHLKEVLKPTVPVSRMVFHEITKEAIADALKSPRKIDQKIVDAQEARRILDRLFGYTLSPLLWKKIALGLSAGRVQSVAVRLIVNREKERRNFVKGSFWDLKAIVTPTALADKFESSLEKIENLSVAKGADFDEQTGKIKNENKVILLDEKSANKIKDLLQDSEFKVLDVKESEQVRNPYAPFITSSLQIEANRKLGFAAKYTMQVAQRLYENGLITYMRTDSTNLSHQALDAIRNNIVERYGKEYLSDEVRVYTKKSKGAQEAHEAIRPAGSSMPTSEELNLSGDESRLYDLIWKRSMATQMKEARVKVISISINSKVSSDSKSKDIAELIKLEKNSKEINFLFKASGRRIIFPGFLRAYVEGNDNPENALDDSEKILPELKVEQVLKLLELNEESHETKPPARYTDATLVKKLEQEGIGRPSTYASIISTIVDRGYIVKKNNQLIPTFTAYSVTNLLEKYFTKLVDLNFTAEMEGSLDKIEEGEIKWLPYLKSFYEGKEGLENQVKEKNEIIDAREMCTLKIANFPYDIRVGKYGAFVEIENKKDPENPTRVTIDESVAPADINEEEVKRLVVAKKESDKPLGTDPVSGKDVYLLVGKYGPYVQLGRPEKESKEKVKRVSIPKTLPLDMVDIKKALQLLELPKTLGQNADGKDVKIGIGRFGPYILIDGVFKSIPAKEDMFALTLDEAIEIFRLKLLKATGRKRFFPRKSFKK
ncbi:MAG: type I DNA topoisomerase [bacterium]